MLERFFESAVCGKPKLESQTKHKTHLRYGEDSYFIATSKNADALGVADGVGSWLKRGIDSGEFAKQLMQYCGLYMQRPEFSPDEPVALLTASFNRLQDLKVHGSCTTCVVVLNRRTGILSSANIGDSGYMVVRESKVIYRSTPVQYRFNTPWQLGFISRTTGLRWSGNAPSDATVNRLQLQKGDIVLVATDGLFDNIFDTDILAYLANLQNPSGFSSPPTLAKTAKKLLDLAYRLSQNANYSSPFNQSASKHRGVHTMSGGKQDDITIVLARVCERDVRRSQRH